MTTKWKDLEARIPADRLAKVNARVAKTLADMPLQELRRAHKFSQARLAEILGMSQPEISKIEHRTDLYVSTLRSYIEAMGGELDIVARFADGRAVRVNQFVELDEETREPAQR